MCWRDRRRQRCLMASVMGLVLLLAAKPLQAVNYEESQVPAYELPDPLTAIDGTAIATAEAWRSERRPELLALFQTHVYGAMPPPLPIAKAVVAEIDEQALGGQAIRQEVDLYFRDDQSGPVIRLLILLPKTQRKSAAPAFVGYNFEGNHTVHADEKIRLQEVWNRDGQRVTPDADSRGGKAARWQAEKLIARGYALVTAHYGDVDPDFDDGFQNGVHALYPEYQDRGDNWSAIGGWAWGLSRILDYLETEPAIDAERVAVIGHSRLGKTALWAGATDERFAMVVSNNSGCGGAALARRRFGETVEAINRRFPHWFCRNHRQYNDNEDALPVDQHQLLALIAPRPLYVASASDDQWSDPRGEFLSCRAADPVYRLLGTAGLPAREWPAVNSPSHGQMGYHLRQGKHDVTAYDWQQYLDFADRHLGRVAPQPTGVP